METFLTSHQLDGASITAILVVVSAHLLGHDHADTPTLRLVIDPDGAHVLSARWYWADGSDTPASLSSLPLWAIAEIHAAAKQRAEEDGLACGWHSGQWWIDRGEPAPIVVSVQDFEAISAERQCGRPRKGTAVSNPASHKVGFSVTAKASASLDRATARYGVSKGVLVEAFARALGGTSDADE